MLFATRVGVSSPEPPPRLMDQVRSAIRIRHYSRRTEEAYVTWIRRDIVFHHKTHPSQMGAGEVSAFLTSLAVRQRVSASTQNPALSALLFLYRHMDYDATNIPTVYDQGRSYGPEVLDLWMNAVSSHVAGQLIATILDLGCGTGRFSEALAVRFDAEVIGVDPSAKMVERARDKRRDRRVRYALGRAEAIPLQDNSVDLIFMSMIFHHLNEPRLAARECRRVLRDQASAFLRTGTLEYISSYPQVEFFPSSRPICEQRLPANAAVREVFEAAGFRTASAQVVTQQVAPSYAVYAERLVAGADSVLVSLSSAELEAGFEALRSYAARAGNQAVFEPIDLFVFQ